MHCFVIVIPAHAIEVISYCFVDVFGVVCDDLLFNACTVRLLACRHFSLGILFYLHIYSCKVPLLRQRSPLMADRAVACACV